MALYRNIVLTLLLLVAGVIAIELRPRPAIAPAEPALSPEAEQILDRRVPNLVVEHGTMRQAIDIIHQETGVEFSVDWAAIPKWDAVPLDVELHNLPLGETIAYLFQMDRQFYEMNAPEQVDFEVVKQTVRITRSDRLPLRHMTLRIYDVRDLLSDEYWGCASGPDPSQTQSGRIDALLNLLEYTAGSRNWDMDSRRSKFTTSGDEPFGFGDIRACAGRLIILQTTRGHRQVRAALQRLRNGGVPPETRERRN